MDPLRTAGTKVTFEIDPDVLQEVPQQIITNENEFIIMNDEKTSVAELKDLVSRFVEERDWSQFHDPKNLVMALASEIGELADIFRWVANDKSLEAAMDPENAQAIANELADILMFALEFASVCGIDLTNAIHAKLRINVAKYPIAKSKGSSRKYDRL